MGNASPLLINPQRRTQSQRREEAETRLIRAALKLLAHRGYDGFSLAEVGQAAGYSRGLPTHHFGRKDDLMAAAARYAVATYVATSSTGLATADPGLPRIVAMIRHHANTPPSDISRALGLLIAEAAIRPSLKETIAGLNRQGSARLRDELLAGIEAGTIRRDVDADTQASMIFAYLRGQMAFTALGQGFDAQTVAEAFIALLQHDLTRRPLRRSPSIADHDNQAARLIK